MSIGGMVDPPPVRPDAVGGPSLRFILLAVVVVACLILGCYLVARVVL